jgi:drug/metabolite transporter (DMT)-like permease
MKIIKDILNKLYNIYFGIPVIITIFLFIVGKLFIKNSLINDDDFLSSVIFFAIGMGLSGLILSILLYNQKLINFNKKKLFNGLLSGFIFFIGNILWIYTISKNVPLSIIQILISAFGILFITTFDYLIFSTKLTMKQIIGILTIFTGIIIIGY